MGTAVSTATPGTPRGAEAAEEFFGGGMRWQEAHGGIIGAAVQNLRARSIKRKSGREATKPRSPSSPGARAAAAAATVPIAEHIYEEPTSTAATVAATRVKFRDEEEAEKQYREQKEQENQEEQQEQLDECSVKLRRSVATSTPALVVRIEREPEEEEEAVGKVQQPLQSVEPVEHQRQLALPLKPPRRKSSRSNSPSIVYAQADEESMLRAKETVSTCSSRQTRN